MRIGELARRAGVTPKAVRYYEALGLLAPERLANGYRDYGEYDVRVVREIRALSGLGIPVERTRPFLDCLAAGHRHADDCPASLAGYRDAIDELTQRIEGLTARRTVLLAHLREAAHRNSRVSPDDEEEDLMTTHASLPASYTTLPAGLPVPEDDGAAAHLPGMKVPPLELRGTADTAVRLDALGTGRTVIYVYPLTGRPGADLPDGWDSIPGARGCTPEACGFRDHHRDLLAAGAHGVFGLSSQDTDYQREVVQRLHLPFQMLSDPERSLAQALGLPTFVTGGLTLYKRLTLIVRDGVIEHVFYPVFPPNEHAAQVLTWLRDNPLETPGKR
ncbi:MerR family transcriptional regulator [Streptomyces sp. MST-110588]|uniref:MerR family transcriptional regulator n=1 Tax=Streptomyces sp. MST-110588 TaxID=2833628 RepID=UPI001F5C3995|nr:MerR family transcriptional regulator [Streptomyces sp. MST-110588]UNO41763.1 redoxin family protein [Streptomyces sp. MST-110588]